MSQPVLDVAGLGKRYAEYGSELKRIANWFGARNPITRGHWALRDIAFSLRGGEALALIGPNGAGKSTLLKLITGTVRPTTGTVAVAGRVSAILELGLGFNPEFTGRQNVRQAGGLMGLSSGEIDRLMPEIEGFAEIDEFFDQPFRTFSSGMGARLMFALATAVRPEILIVDEVLSVGDAYFQHKIFSRIREFRNAGTSILLVTHSMADVRELCDRVLLLDKGKIAKEGPPDEVIDYYNALVATKELSKLTIQQRRQKSGWVMTRSGTFEAVVARIELLNPITGAAISTAAVGQSLRLDIDVAARGDIPELVLGIMVRDRTGHVVYGTNTWHARQVESDLKANEVVTYEILLGGHLGVGSYSLTVSVSSSDTHLVNNFEWSDNLIVFDVINGDRPFFIGTTALDANFRVRRS